MAEAEAWKVDRSTWLPGPWDGEPDRLEWRTAAGYPALLVRSRVTGALCGYVAVPPGHPAHGKKYDDVPVDVHGGLTFSEACDPDLGPICHVPLEGEPADVWWLGFDCAHCFDRSPAMAAFFRHYPSPRMDVYRPVAYVQAQCESLALQLAALPALQKRLDELKFEAER